MRARWAMLLVALALVGGFRTAESADRLDEFKILARRYADASDADTAAKLLAQLFSVVDHEVLDNLRSGGIFASPEFIQDRVKAFSDEWGGVAFAVTQPTRRKGAPTLGLFAATRGELRGSLRIYGRSRGDVALLAATTHEGALEVREWPAGRGGATQFLASWVGAPGGRASRSLLVELWRYETDEGAARVWSSADAFPGGLLTTGFQVKDGQLLIRHEFPYPGWKPGCADETEEEDLYQQSAGSGQLLAVRRRTVNGWHRELHVSVTRFFEAVRAGDRQRLAELAPDAAMRARLPRELEPEAVCDTRDPDAGGAVVVAATERRGAQRVPWSLAWRRGPSGWRLTAASPMLQ
jgi:hypothetical protein